MEPLTRGLPPQIPILSALSPQLNLLNPPEKFPGVNPPTPEKIPGYATAKSIYCICVFV
jgi:hypothetical protein